MRSGDGRGPADAAGGRSPRLLVAVVCTAQVLVQIGAYVWPALLPGLIPAWQLGGAEAGWITAAFYAAYLVAVPVLVTLTDRIDAKWIYLCGVALTVAAHAGFALVADGMASALAARALAGVGWAGTYMTGLRLLADRVDERLMARAVAGHAASIGIAGALSFAFADLVAGIGGWRAAFAVSAVAAGVAWLAVALMVPRRPPRTGPPPGLRALFDFAPVLRNRSAMAYALVYCLHTMEMSAVRGWAVVFLGFIAAGAGGATLMAPATVATLLALVGVGASMLGSEAAIRFGRRRLIVTALLASIAIGAGIGFLAPLSYGLAIALLVLYGAAIWLDSASLTAGAAGTAEPGRRGATLAVHSMLGYAGGCVGPVLVGVVLDLAGGPSRVAWGAAFALVSACMALALVVFWRLRPRGVTGDVAVDN